MSAVRNNAPVPLEPELEHQVLLIAARTGVSRADVIQECVRDRLQGGTFRAPFPFPVKHPADSAKGYTAAFMKDGTRMAIGLGTDH